MHLARDGDRIRNDADEVRRVDDVEQAIRERQVCGIHLEQAHILNAFPPDPLFRLRQHRRRQIDAGHRAVLGVQSGRNSGSDANLQDLIAGPDPHALDRLQTSLVQRRSVHDVIDGREVTVDALDEVVFHCRD